MNNGFIKIVTGLRRCGKSYLLKKLFYAYLIRQNVPADHIIVVNLDDQRNRKLWNPDALSEHIDAKITDNNPYFIILDEIQLVEDFKGVLNGLLYKDNVDVYVTGSNSRFLSSDVATEFRGRGDEIHLYPLSFAEFFSAYDGSVAEAWDEYMLYGGLPVLKNLPEDSRKIDYLKRLYRTVYLKDIYERHNTELTDEFEELVKTLASSIGSPVNPHNLSNTFKSKKNKSLSDKTIALYLKHLEDAFIMEKSERYDIRGKQYIGTLSKYYFQDIGIRNAVLNYRQQDFGHIMENIIYNELRLRGLQVDVGNVPVRLTNSDNSQKRISYEVDFVANKGSQRYYIQSAYQMLDEEKIKQEMQSFLRINDSFKKIIIVGGAMKPRYNEYGFLMMGVTHFLLDNNSLNQ